jgi:hypothetical protein
MDSSHMLDLQVKDIRLFMLEIFRESKSEDLFQWADERNLTPELFEATCRLTAKLGGEVTLPARPNNEKAENDKMKRLGILIGKSRHLKLTKATWHLIVGAIPLLVGAIAASISPTDLASAGSSLVLSISENLEKINPEEWKVYLATKKISKLRKRPARRDEIIAEISSIEGGHSEKTSKIIDDLASKGIIKEKEGGFNVVF